MRSAGGWAVVVLAGCGRIAFDPEGDAQANIREWLASNVSGEQTHSPMLALTDQAWTLVETTHTVIAPNVVFLDFYVPIIGGTIGDCILIDDLYMGQLL